MFRLGPVPETSVITSLYGSQEFGLRSSPHRGVDFGVPVGTPISAPEDGVVTAAYTATDDDGGGKVIFLDHPTLGVRTAYLHLSSFNVSPGETVRAGKVIAFSGDTGDVTGPHLHFEVRRGVEREDPLPWLPWEYPMRAGLVYDRVVSRTGRILVPGILIFLAARALWKWA